MFRMKQYAANTINFDECSKLSAKVRPVRRHDQTLAKEAARVNQAHGYLVVEQNVARFYLAN